MLWTVIKLSLVLILGPALLAWFCLALLVYALSRGHSWRNFYEACVFPFTLLWTAIVSRLTKR